MITAKKRLPYILLISLCILFSSELYGQEIFDSTYVKSQEVIYFDSGKHILVDSHFTILDTFINKFNKSKDYSLYIDAHTDDVGTAASNLKLSNNRKQSVFDYLIKQGINDSLIVSRFHGESQLLSTKKDANSRQINRRAVIKVIAKESFIRLTGQLIDKVSNEGISGLVELNTTDYNIKVNTNLDGSYSITAPLDQIATIDFYAKNYFFNTRTIKISDKIKSLSPISLQQVSAGGKFRLQDLNFVPNTNIIVSHSRPNLDKLKQFMTTNDTTCIELAGHINSNKHSLSSRGHLSAARSLIIYERLKEIGVDEERMIAKGYNDQFKIFPDPQTFEQMRTNMRVEVYIRPCDSIKHLANDLPSQPQHYNNIVINRNFNQKTFQEEIKFFHSKHQLDIMMQVRALKDSGEDASIYTYGELREAGKLLKYKDNKLAIQLHNAYNSDQALRQQSKDIENKYGKNSEEFSAHWHKINKQDAENLKLVKDILDEHGWLSAHQVGENGNAALFLILQHANLPTQIEYLPMLRDAVKSKKANPQDLALMEDRVAVRQGKKQIYGSQIHTNPETGEYIVAPLLNPAKVNERRKTIGLAPIEHYVMRWNINWIKELKRLTAEK